MFVSGKERILNRILRVGCIAQESISASVERRQALGENVFHFSSCASAVVNIKTLSASFVCVCLCLLHVVFLQYDNRRHAVFQTIAMPLSCVFSAAWVNWVVRDCLMRSQVSVLRSTECPYFDWLPTSPRQTKSQNTEFDLALPGSAEASQPGTVRPAPETKSKPPSQWSDDSRGGRTAKATDALGELPYARFDAVTHDSVALFMQTTKHICVRHRVSRIWHRKCIQQL